MTSMKKQKLYNPPLFVLLVFSALLVFTACGQSPEKQAETAIPVENEVKEEAPALVEVAIAELLADPFSYENREVRIEGVISHVCRHSGDKMRVQQDESELSIQVKLGEFTGQFNTESEGTRVIVWGTLMTEVANLEELEAHQHEGEEDHECETTQQAIEAMKAKGLDPKVNTFIKLGKYEIVVTS